MSFAGLRDLVLHDEHVLLRRISVRDRTALREFTLDPRIWEYFVSVVHSDEDLDRFLEEAIRDTSSGARHVFVIIDRASGAIVGSSAYGSLSVADKRLEIGWSFLAPRVWGGVHNRSAKFLLLEHAFSALAAERVEFKTDVLNLRARRGLEKIGATAEGTLRSFNFMPSGRRRDAIYYSILRSEWPGVRARLRDEVGRG